MQHALLYHRYMNSGAVSVYLSLNCSYACIYVKLEIIYGYVNGLLECVSNKMSSNFSRYIIIIVFTQLYLQISMFSNCSIYFSTKNRFSIVVHQLLVSIVRKCNKYK